MTLQRVLHAEEILDQPAHDLARLEHSLDHVAQINRLLGGNRGVIGVLKRVLPRRGRVLDVGTGSGALPRAIVRWARSEKRDLQVTATDIHPQTLEIARNRSRAYSEILTERADALNLPYAPHSFDVAVLSLTLHHFEGDRQAQVLQQLARVARVVVVSELERCWPNYLGARLLAATWWRGNPITRHDGPLSVLRAYTAAELRELALQAGLGNARVERQFFYRLLLTAEGQASAA